MSIEDQVKIYLGDQVLQKYKPGRCAPAVKTKIFSTEILFLIFSHLNLTASLRLTTLVRL